FLGGLACALAGLRSSGSRRKVAWHAAAVLLYVMTVFTYEAFLVFLPLCALAYLLIADRRTVLPRWGADLAAFAFAAATAGRVAKNQRAGHLTISHLWHRVEDVLPGAIHVFGWSIPGEAAVPILLVVFFAAAGVGVLLALRRDDPLSHPAREW